ncbi:MULTISPECIES: hypothetical protein [Allobacillus]|nr:hypothetical protein [Allobacillus salarius]
MPEKWTLESRELFENQFRVLFDLKETDSAVSFQQLLDEEFLSSYLPDLKEQFQTNQLLALGSQFIKRLGFILTVPALFLLATSQKKLNVQLKYLYLVSRIKEDLWMPHLYQKSWDAPTVEHKADRESYLNQVIQEIAKIISAVHRVAKVPRPLLWENVAVYIYWLYETRLQDENLTLLEQKEAWNDFAYLLQLDPQCFDERFNPLHRFYTNKIDVKGNDQPIRVRRTCCFYYETNTKQKYCQGCPKTDVNKAACMVTKRQVLPIEAIKQ